MAITGCCKIPNSNKNGFRWHSQVSFQPYATPGLLEKETKKHITFNVRSEPQGIADHPEDSRFAKRLLMSRRVGACNWNIQRGCQEQLSDRHFVAGTRQMLNGLVHEPVGHKVSKVA